MSRQSLLTICAALAVMPLTSPAGAAAGVVIRDIEVTQAIQNLDNDVRLVTRRPAVARVYVGTSDGTPIARIGGHLTAKLNGAPLIPARSRCVNLVNATRTYNPTRTRVDPFRTLICPLPSRWVEFAGALEITAVAEGPPRSGPAASRTSALEVHNDHRLTIEVIPVRDGCKESCTSADGPTPSQMRLAMRHILDLYPVSRLDLVMPQGWIAMPDSRNASELMLYVREGNKFSSSSAAGLPTAGRDRVRIGILRSGTTFIDANRMEEKLNGSCDGVDRVGFVLLGPNDPRITAAHEVGHCVGMEHVPDGQACPVGTAPPTCEAYPYDPTTLSDGGPRDHYGWDSASGPKFPGSHGDIMSYQARRWISDYTYLKIHCLLENLSLPLVQRQPLCGTPATGTVSPAPDGDEFLMIHVAMRPGVPTVEALRSMRVRRPYVDFDDGPAPLDPLDPSGSHALILLAADGSFLLDYPFNPTSAHLDGDESPIPILLASILIPAVAEFGEIRLVDLMADKVIATVEASAEPPVVEVHDVPTLVQESELILTWSAEDPDGDALHATVLFSDDGGESWQPAAIGLDGADGIAQLDTTNWPQTHEGRIALLVSDGVHTSETQIGPFEVPNKAPTVTAVGPRRSQIRRGMPFEVRAIGFDAEDGPLEGESLAWTSDRDGFLGTGTSLWAPQLSTGRHRLKVTARDVDGETTTAAVTLWVRPGAARGRGQEDRDVVR